MIIYWPTLKDSLTTSIDPGVENVLAGVHYEIDDVPLTGILNRTEQILGSATIVGQCLKATLQESIDD